jgi:hypothetical protein
MTADSRDKNAGRVLVLVEVGREHWQSRAKRASAPFPASAEPRSGRYFPCVGQFKSSKKQAKKKEE